MGLCKPVVGDVKAIVWRSSLIYNIVIVLTMAKGWDVNFKV